MDYADVLKHYEALVAGHDGLTLKGKANKYTSMNGNMFTFLDKESTLCLRLRAEDREAFGSDPVIQYGAVMKEYVAVPEAMLGTDALTEWFAKSVAYAGTLKSKPTTRKKR